MAGREHQVMHDHLVKSERWSSDANFKNKVQKNKRSIFEKQLQLLQYAAALSSFGVILQLLSSMAPGKSFRTH